MKSLKDYDKMILDRPAKFTAEEADYSKAEGPERCSNCIHLFTREIDGYRVCEIVRPEPEASIKLTWKCKFQTADGEQFPLLEANR